MGLDCTHIKGRMEKLLNEFRFLGDFWRPGRRLVKFEKILVEGRICPGKIAKFLVFRSGAERAILISPLHLYSGVLLTRPAVFRVRDNVWL